MGFLNEWGYKPLMISSTDTMISHVEQKVCVERDRSNRCGDGEPGKLTLIMISEKYL